MLSHITPLIVALSLALRCTAVGAQVAAPERDSGAVSSPDDLLPGVLRPWREVVQAAPFDGVLMRVDVSEGQRVTEGEVVAVMDNRIALAAVAAAEVTAERVGAVEHARQGLTLAEARLARLTSSQAKGATPEISLDEARTEFEQARATLLIAVEQVTQAMRNLELERSRLEQHYIRAPFAGRVVRVLGEEGEAMTTASPIVAVIALDQLRVDLHLPVRLYGSLEVGAAYVLRGSAPVPGPIRARLEVIEPVIDPATRTFRCTFSVENPGERMPAGFTVYPAMDGAELARAGDDRNLSPAFTEGSADD